MTYKGEDPLLMPHWLQEYCPGFRGAGVCLHGADLVVAGNRSSWLRSAFLASRCIYRVVPMLPHRFVGGVVRTVAANKTYESRAARVFSCLLAYILVSFLYDRHICPLRQAYMPCSGIR